MHVNLLNAQSIPIRNLLIFHLYNFVPVPARSSTKELLPALYSTKERGKINVKGKGEMTTYWVESKANRKPPMKDEVCASTRNVVKDDANRLPS